MPVLDPIHPLLARELAKSKRLLKFFNSLPDSTREQIDHTVREVKKEETRQRRVEQAIELLTETMEAELDPPPLILSAFARTPRARLGWELMPQFLRRQYLIAIFRSRFPDTRARNLEFTLRQCEQYADRPPSAHKPNVET
jgi:uncharacterized protein YdeI (YjbR/CyaY-like superfamily)